MSQTLNRNKEEITTTINALTCLNYTDFISSNLNLIFGRENVFKDTLKAIFKTVIAKKIQLLQPNCFSRKELEETVVNLENILV